MPGRCLIPSYPSTTPVKRSICSRRRHRHPRTGAGTDEILPAVPDPSGTVTFLFADVEGSTRLLQEYPAAIGAALARYHALLSGIVLTYGGAVFETLGDGVYAAFPLALPAVIAALEAQRALRSEEWGEVGAINVRMALHAGEVERWGDHYFGPPLFRVARLLAIGHGGQVLLSQVIADLVREALPEGATIRAHGSHRLKDLAQPERVFELGHRDFPGEFPPLKSLNLLPNNLPLQLTQFVGRERELAELTRLVRAQRLVTLTGSGGAGKTRLALQLAADMLDDFEDGVWLVELASLSDASLIPRQVAATLGVREEPSRSLVATLVDSVRARRLLLLLDNCEHLVAACADLVENLLHSCPFVRVLATSREALGLLGEWPWRVPSLSVPEPRLSAVGQLTKYDAVRLFFDRAAAVLPTFAATDYNAQKVAQVCGRLDGIPLAIELAAARMNVLTIDQIAERLDDRFRLLTAGRRTAPLRQQTLRAAVDWSHELLGPPERVLFRLLSVFAGGFDLRAIEEVCREALGGAEVLEVLGFLVDKSLVGVEAQPQGIRYRLHETLRQYALEKLRDAGEDTAARDRHLAYFLSLAEDAYSRRVYLPTEWLARLEIEHDNLRAALDWSGEHSGDQRLRLAGALAWFWDSHSHRTEGRQRLLEALAHATGTSHARARALWGASALASWAGDTAGLSAVSKETAVRLGEESLAMWRELGDREEVALALWQLGWGHFVGGDEEGALPFWEESLVMAESLGNRWIINRARLGLCQILVARGDVDAARPIADTGLAVGLELGDPWAVHFAHHFLGDCALMQGDFVRSERKYADSLRSGMETGADDIASGQIQGIAMAVGGQGRFVKSLRLDEAAEAAFKEFGVDPSGIRFWQALRSRFVGASAKAVGAEAAMAARAEGRAMGYRAAAAYALDFGRD